MQMKNSLRGETAWPGFDSASSPSLMTPITAAMKAQFWPWQQCCWGKTEGQICVQKAGTDPDQQMACNDSSIRSFLRANWADELTWVDTGLAMALSLGRGFLEPAGSESQWNTLRVYRMSCSYPARFVKRGLIFRLIEQNPPPITGAAMLLLLHRHHWPLPAQFRGQWNQPKLLLAVWETFLPPLIVFALFIAPGSNTATTLWSNLPKPTCLLSCWP